MSSPRPDPRFDWATLSGLLLAAGSIVGGLLLEGGSVLDIAQYTAALIVVGGTLGAVLVSTPRSVLEGCGRRLRGVWLERHEPLADVENQLVGYAQKARRQGLVSLEAEALREQDPYLRKALSLAVDGTDLHELKHMLELDIVQQEARAEAEARVLDSAGGYAPTIGILGAVLGLIQVMKHLDDIHQVGHGIAVAFVATVYGVALANLVLLPAASKMRARATAETIRMELIREGILAIVEGLNPQLMRTRLSAYRPQKSEGEQPRPLGKVA